ncbi:CotH kinase family protein [Streptomyces sp. NPDC006510]|uniref:CotH kinase family protein n=1 Tax=Streptomyces sp. NPDC006510 TaxID=3155600 RepID=UPI0033A8CCFF
MSGDPTARKRRRLRDRVPVRLRHHWKPAGALCAGLAVMVYAFGDARISPYVTSASRVEADVITQDVKGAVDLYDTSVTHSIALEYDQTDFDKMMKEFRDEGTKDSIKADLTIDGVYLKDVGIRLKGNSTLMSLRGNGQGMPGGGRAPGGAEQGAPQQPPQGGGVGGQDRGQANGRGPGENKADGGGMGAMGGITQYNLSADKPEELPWLITIDEYVEGRAYQGEREISLRPGSNAQVPVNEALSLSLMDESGEPAEQYSLSKVKVNNRPVATRLMVENPDTEYAQAIDGNGVLYKARAGGSFAYRGDDPSDYETSFRQLNKVGSQDLEPVMKLIKWADKASDKEFAEDLDKYVDVESLSKYVAAQNLLMNFDDMAGPGKNYLLWYDLDTKKFSVLGWDYNLTFNGDAKAGPDDRASMGGLPGGGVQRGQDGRMPEGMPENMPEGFPQGMPGGEGQDKKGESPVGKDGLMGHALKDRFLELDAFDSVYKEAYKELYEKFFGSGAALKELENIAGQAREAGAGSKALDSTVKTLRKTITERTQALAKNKEVTG